MTQQTPPTSRLHVLALLAALTLACSATAVSAGSNDNATGHAASAQHAITQLTTPSAMALPDLPKVDAHAPLLAGQPYMHATVARVGADGQLQVLCVDDMQPVLTSQLQRRADVADIMMRVK